jgi:excisionase family DNA binding protein
MQYYTVAEFASMLKFSRSKIYKMAESGELPSLKIGGALRFTEKHLDLLVQASERNSGIQKAKKPDAVDSPPALPK